MRRIEPVEVTYFDRKPHIPRPWGEEPLQVSQQFRRVARRLLKEHGCVARPELPPRVNEVVRPFHVFKELSLMADRLRDLWAEPERNGHILQPTFQGFLR